MVLNIADSCVFSTQELGGSLQGECTDFQAVSGRGLHCVVSGVEKYAVREGESSETLTRHLYSSTEVSLVPSNIQDLVGTAHPQKKYQVSILCPRPLPMQIFLHSYYNLTPTHESLEKGYTTARWNLGRLLYSMWEACHVLFRTSIFSQIFLIT